MARLPLITSIRNTVKRSRKNVFLRNDFASLGDYDQVGRALRQLVTQGVLIKIGQGLYAKAKINRFTREPMPACPGGFYQVATEALTRLNIKWKPDKAINEYQQGLTTQIPAKPTAIVYSRVSRKIAIKNKIIKIVKAVS